MIIYLWLWAVASAVAIGAGSLKDRAARWFGPRTPMGVDDTGRLVPYNPDLHATTETRLMLAQVRAWTEPRFEDAT